MVACTRWTAFMSLVIGNAGVIKYKYKYKYKYK